MARHNHVSMLGLVRKAPIVQESPYGVRAVCAVTIIRGTRDDNFKLVDNQYKYSSPLVIAEEKCLVEEIGSWTEWDVVRIDGFIATREVDKASICPKCGTENHRTEACLSNGTRSGGNRVYVYPIFAEKVTSFQEQGEAHHYVIQRTEISNKVMLIGNLTRDPIQGTLEGSKNIYTRYQIAINRKYCAAGMESVYERTDYPWIYSYGEQSKKDYERLHSGMVIFVDGAIQTRKYKEAYRCKNCGQEYMVPGKTMEILSYATEYFDFL